MKFFEPNKKFLPAIRKLVPRASIVIDCGCGEGQVTKLLNENRINAIGVDLFPLEDFTNEKENIYNLNAEHYPFSEESIPLICRPCPGDWYFNTIDNALKRGSRYVIYVGVSKNYKRDIVSLRKKYQIVLVDKYVGASNESMYLIMKKEEKITQFQNNEETLTFCLVKTPYWEFPNWVEDRNDNYWHNYVGGRSPKSPKDEILETKTGTIDFEDLDWSSCGVLEDTKKCGWLSPNGDFYGCSYCGHDRVAHLILKQKTDTLMDFGWVRVHSPKDWCCYKELTAQQQFFMTNNNYDMKYHYGLGDNDEAS